MRLRALLVALTVLASPSLSHAAPITLINILSESYRIDLSTSSTPYDDDYNQGPTTTLTRSVESLTPTSASLITHPTLLAEGDADTFAVSTHTEAIQEIGFGDLYRASTDTMTSLLFVPLSDTMATIGIDLVGPRSWTFGRMWLADITTGETLASHQFDHINFLTPVSEQMSFDVPLNVTHTYGLTLRIGSSAALDGQSRSMQLAGLQRVPEPATLLLFGAGACVALRRRVR